MFVTIKDVNETIKKLDENYPRWRTIDIKTIDLDASELGRLISNLVLQIKDIMITNDISLEDVESKISVPNGIPEFIRLIVFQTMRYYTDFSKFRKVAETDIDAAKFTLTSIFKNYVLSYDPYMIDECKFYCTDDGVEYIDPDVIGALKCLTDYYIIKNYVKVQIRGDFRKETLMPHELCKHYAKLVYKNRMELKQNLILKTLYPSIQKK